MTVFVAMHNSSLMLFVFSLSTGRGRLLQTQRAFLIAIHKEEIIVHKGWEVFVLLRIILCWFISDSPVAEIQRQSESPVLKHKKNFKIWFSPRSRKVRCTVEKSSEVTAPDNRSSGETAATRPDTTTAQGQDLSVFNFTSSSQDSSASQKLNSENRNRKKRPTKKNAARRKASVQAATRTTRKQTSQMMKKNRLEAINQQWGISGDVDAFKEKEQPSAEGPRRASKRVSFLNPAVTSDQPKPEEPKGGADELSAPLTGGSTTEINYSTPDRQRMSDGVVQQSSPPANDLNPTEDLEKQETVSPPKPPSKRTRVVEKVCALETTPKRPKTSPGRRRKPQVQLSPVVRDLTVLTSPVCRNSPRCHGTPVGRASTGSPAVTKRNHKGESPLHLAAIKVELWMIKVVHWTFYKNFSVIALNPK